MLVHTVLQTLMVEDLLENCCISTEDLDLLAAFESQDNITDEMHVAFKKVQSEVADWKAMFKDDPTATLWINYMGYVDIVKRYIRAEHTGDWMSYLSSVNFMLNLFAATGHLHYAKSGRFYLQQMCELDSKHPEVYNAFVSSGYHAVRRSDRFWSRLWCFTGFGEGIGWVSCDVFR